MIPIGAIKLSDAAIIYAIHIYKLKDGTIDLDLATYETAVSNPGVNLTIEQVDELIAALQAAKGEE